MEIKVPDIGGFHDVPVIEIHVKPGDPVAAEDALITLESDKATMDVPSPQAGVVEAVMVNLGDKISEGTVIVRLAAAAPEKPAAPTASSSPLPLAASPAFPAPAVTPAPPSSPPHAGPIEEAAGEAAGFIPTEAEPTHAPPVVSMPTPAEMLAVARGGGKHAHASPSVRRFARELGVDIDQVRGTGPKERITQEDVQQHVKTALAGATAPSAPPERGGLDLLPWPEVDFAKFGPIDRQPRSRIQKISGANLTRNWVMIPAVTYHEDADITDLDAFRIALNRERQDNETRITLLAFIIKAAVAALQQFPQMNSSLDGDDLVLKHYWNIGFAADTPHGLMVPVLKAADQKGVLAIATETAELAKKAREGRLAPIEMQGATFTISSVGGMGGTGFSPIVNAPEVAILGVSRSTMKPVWNGKEFVPRLILPLSLSADHRVIDGALATRFNAALARLLGDFRRVLL